MPVADSRPLARPDDRAIAARPGSRPRLGPGWAWLLLVASALWLPVNNGVVEGPVLISIGTAHGLTTSDLFGVAGACVAAAALVRRGRHGRRVALRVGCTVVLCAAVFALGALAAYLTG